MDHIRNQDHWRFCGENIRSSRSKNSLKKLIFAKKFVENATKSLFGKIFFFHSIFNVHKMPNNGGNHKLACL